MSQLLQANPLFLIYAVTDDQRFVIAEALSKETALEKAREIRSWSHICLEIFEPTGRMIGKVGY